MATLKKIDLCLVTSDFNNWRPAPLKSSIHDAVRGGKQNQQYDLQSIRTRRI
ncbi:hypothetical protein COEREDRAFT_79181 [Coemansia reversa NRRL 1564]|uniref:Uncharacterized protein n=1 Tax=Coemansia reversa (strain ATCC 12441 / NRRL 1564) TaxID=763665 RepID=A0A2G5BKF5_COERN|nr:hypothetical protein COEREDRAFT_79181 [Coemansia reversa NRRL 1564]|eukprot:PIA19227.1 hypothetical protein COEREDRAFT_79181 [Coemansia reversa NRRL 1564]